MGMFTVCVTCVHRSRLAGANQWPALQVTEPPCWIILVVFDLLHPTGSLSLCCTTTLIPSLTHLHTHTHTTDSNYLNSLHFHLTLANIPLIHSHPCTSPSFVATLRASRNTIYISDTVMNCFNTLHFTNRSNISLFLVAITKKSQLAFSQFPQQWSVVSLSISTVTTATRK